LLLLQNENKVIAKPYKIKGNINRKLIHQKDDKSSAKDDTSFAIQIPQHPFNLAL
jgi:hypothetical protein